MAPEPRERVAILGLGLIGGSLGLAWRAQGAAAEVIGYDLSPRAAERALALGAVDRVVDEPAEAAAAGTVIVLAAPVSAILE
ncbi:MAG: prephenate dehydrogenase/arogenate dehydrogenase family protein, partial [Clostridia bacterium]|nr:prephenate dehydrogenase/arogenate dehydrogenase family protein [Clostridia bacterium]